MRLTRPTPTPEYWAAVEPERQFRERLDWYRRQPPPKWPSGLVRLFVSIQMDMGRDLLRAGVV
jgi:hypothetical protein